MTALGLLSSIAFSASYQLVVHFANKNTISLGLGCAGSGVLVLLLESLLNVGAAPTFRQLVVLFGIGTGKQDISAQLLVLTVRRFRAVREIAFLASNEYG